MAKISVRLFGVYRIDTHIAHTEIEAEKLSDVLDELNRMATGENKSSISFSDATVFVNGEHCKKKKQKLNDGDEVWILSPASGG
ncbi:MAG: MoaD/ThiS family protein [Clostridia bacterium]|nr:MoaD/ThiS family protein [Clostridia bacterium]MBQ9880072.1 MoaD/ThiS family protein [Clostridia bacterium]MCR5689215.1 MoaD/ThiS family protein [Clostridiales bacterium]